MGGGSDPFSSVSFLDLLACSLCVAVVLLIFAGGNDSSPASEQGLHILQIDDQLKPPDSLVDPDTNPFNLLALRIGGYVLVSQSAERPCWHPPLTYAGETCRKEAVPGSQHIRILESSVPGCIRFDGPVVPMRELIPAARAFHWIDMGAFAKEVEAAYGVKVDVGVLPTKPQRFSLTLTRDSAAQGSGPDVQIAYRRASGRASELTLWTLNGRTSRSLSRTFAGGTAMVEPKDKPFSHSAACIAPVEPNGEISLPGAVAHFPILLLSLRWSVDRGLLLDTEEDVQRHKTEHPIR